jgi:hypothetical protein
MTLSLDVIPTVKWEYPEPLSPTSSSEEGGGWNTHPPCSQVLDDDASRSLFLEHERYLKRLVSEGRERLQSMGYYRSTSHGASLRRIVTRKLDRSNNATIQKLEADLTEATEDVTDFTEQAFDGNLAFDFEEQHLASDMMARAALRRIDSADFDEDFQEATISSAADHSVDKTWQWSATPVPLTSRMVRVTSDVRVQLRGALETWQAICNDTTVVTSCKGCQRELHVLQDAAYVVCRDCWVVGNIEQSFGGISMELDEDADELFGVTLGIKSTDVLEWIEEKSDPTIT